MEFSLKKLFGGKKKSGTAITNVNVIWSGGFHSLGPMAPKQTSSI